MTAEWTIRLVCWALLGIGLWRVSGWLTDHLFSFAWVRRIAMLHGQHLPVDGEENALTDEVLDICVQALERALEAMKDDPKLAEREVEWVLEQIDAA